MSPIGTRIRNRRTARHAWSTRAEETSLTGKASPGNTPYWLLWSTGIVAFVVCIVAFALWSTNGAGTLFEMIVALCT